jgi:hypothetical protein
MATKPANRNSPNSPASASGWRWKTLKPWRIQSRPLRAGTC